MKHPFTFLTSSRAKNKEKPQSAPDTSPQNAADNAPAAEHATDNSTPPHVERTPEDAFTEWCRSQVRGGIERRERNDIYEAYTVYGVDESGQLACLCYHRYPEHERSFALSYRRTLSFDAFNQRLLGELDKGGIRLADYRLCIARAEQLTDPAAPGEPADTGATASSTCQNTAASAGAAADEGFTDAERASLRDFCEALDHLKDKEYRSSEGIEHCSCKSLVGEEELNLWFRKPMKHDALFTTVSGVNRAPVNGYDIDNLWIMGVYNRLYERCGSCKITLLTSAWSLRSESVYLMSVEGFSGVDGTLLIAVAESSNFARFGFYALDFSGK